MSKGRQVKQALVIIAVITSWFLLSASAQESLNTDGVLPAQYQGMFTDLGNSYSQLSPNQKWLVLAVKASYKDYQSTAKAQYFKAVGKALHTGMAIQKNTPEYSHILLIDLNSQEQRKIAIANSTFVDFRWSPNSEKIALAVKQEQGVYLWQYQLGPNKLRKWFDKPLSAQLKSATTVWLPDSERAIVRQSLLQTPKTSPSAYQPAVRNSTGVAANRVYRDLLDTREKQTKFQQLVKQQAVLVSDERVTTLSTPSMLEKIAVSPNGRYLLTIQLNAEINGSVKYSRLARRYQVIDIATGQVVYEPEPQQAATKKAKIKDSAPYGSRSLRWQANKPATLTWVATNSDEGVDEQNAVLDTIYALPAPFEKPAKTLTTSNWRVFDYYWTKQGRLVSIEWKYADKQIKIQSYSTESNEPNEANELSGQNKLAGQRRVTLEQYNYRNKYADPGDIDTETTPLGNTEARSYGDNQIYLIANGITENGQQPYITAYGVDGQKQRIFTSKNNQVESPLYLLKDNSVIALCEANSKPHVLNIISQQSKYTSLYDWASSKLPYVHNKPLTLQFKREDGLAMSTDVYLPETAGNQKVPAVVWVYPVETTYERGQQRHSQAQKFIPIQANSYLTPLLEGVAVVDMSNFPIVRPEQGEANDTFVQQQIMNSKALIKALKATGKIDTSKLMLMGHSYGAFSTLSLLAYTDDFAAGIAKSGAYNRTLTPLGFQQEKRNMWQAPELYQQMSPLFQADKINEPVLLIHGTEDQNPGTSPLQSKMMFQAIQANKGTARLVLLPDEGHHYQIKENIQLMLQQQAYWIRTYL